MYIYTSLPCLYCVHSVQNTQSIKKLMHVKNVCISKVVLLSTLYSLLVMIFFQANVSSLNQNCCISVK